MNSTVFRISLDIHEVNSQVTLHVKKGDSARQILIALTEGGRPYRISEDCMAVFTAKKPDETILYNGCEIQGNRILYAMTPQTCTAVGAMKCEIRVYGAGGELITSPRFTILVDDTVYSDGDVVDSASEFSALTALVVQAKELVESLEVAERKVVIARAPLGVDYTAEVEELELTTGTEILLLPQSANASAPTLSINGGEAYPLCLRPGWNVTGDDRNPQLTLPIPEGMLLRGAEYLFRLEAECWILQSYVAMPANEYIDVTEDYRKNDDYRDHPEEYLRSLGAGKWMIDDGWALYKLETFALEGQEWRIEQSWTDDGFYTLRKLNADREVLYIDTADEEIRVNGNRIDGSGGIEILDEDPQAPADGAVWINTKEAIKSGSVIIGVSKAEMEQYVTKAIKDAFAGIAAAEEGAY